MLDPAMSGLFRRLIEPHDPAAFAADIWEQRSMVFQGERARYDAFGLDFARFAQVLGDLAPGSIRANRVDPDGTGHYFPLAPEACRNGFEQGLTICATNLHVAVPELVALARDTRRTLALAGAVGVNAYLSPAGRGFGLHFDPQSVFILQLEGEKHWTFATHPAARFPTVGMDAHPPSRRELFRERFPAIALAEPDACAWQHCVLRPGDALYLPPGAWHQGRAGDYSLALTLTCCTQPVSSLLAPSIDQDLFAGEGWRRNLPCGLTAEGELSRERFLTERIEDLRAWAAAVTPQQLAWRWDQAMAADAFPEL
jgi:hypothetical protein